MVKLIYFPIRGRIEPARLMLELAGAQYEIEPISAEQWATGGKERMLGCTPLGQLPVMEDGGLTLCQSLAINRYLARKLDLHGDTIEREARIDEVAETAHELLIDMAILFWDPQFAGRRAEHRQSMIKTLALLESYFDRVRADAEHWVLPGRYTMADAAMAHTLETVLPLHPGLLEGFPKLHHATVAFFAADRIRDYVRSDRRPRTWTLPQASFGGKPEETHHWTR